MTPAPFRESFEESSIAKSSTGTARNEVHISEAFKENNFRWGCLNAVVICLDLRQKHANDVC